MAFTIDSMKPSKSDFSNKPLLEAQVSAGNNTYFFSQYDCESHWYLDCRMINNLPDFNHGTGARSGLSKLAAQGELHNSLENYKVIALQPA